MPKVEIKKCGAIGVIKDAPPAELEMGAWSDALNVRFIDGAALQFLGHGQVYNSPAYAPQFLMPLNVALDRYWLYASAGKQFVTSNSSGTTTHTDITHATPRAGAVNKWSGFVFGGVPVLNAGDGTAPMYWDQDLTHKFVDLPAWPAATSCIAMRQFKNLIVALGVTKASVRYPYMLKWSSLAVPGALPATWNESDATKDAGEFDLAEGQDKIIDGLGLKDSLIVYKESSTHAIDYIGGQFVLKSRKVSGMSGILNMNCAVAFDVDGFTEAHFAVTGFDIVIHDGYSAQSVLDKKARRSFFQSIDVENADKVFCFKNPFLNEVFVAYPAIGSTSCDMALVYNYVDKTVTYRTLPNLLCAAFGPVDNSLSGNWNQDSDPWDTDLTAWNGPDFTPDTARVMMGSADSKLFLLDASASFDGVLPAAYLERTGITFGAPERIKLVKEVRPRITGSPGGTVIVKVGYAENLSDTPTYTTMTYTIGETLRLDPMVSGRFIALRFETGTAYSWRLDAVDLIVEDAGAY